MADVESETVSVTDRIKPVTVDGPVLAAYFLRQAAIFVCTEEMAVMAEGDDTMRIGLHGGGILCSSSDGKRLITGGDDGKVVGVDARAEIETIAIDPKRRWIDNVAQRDNTIAWSAGKTAFVRSAKGEIKSLDVDSTVGGLAFAPKGLRLAIARYNGVTLWFPNMQGEPEELEWRGSHLGVVFSPDGKFICTAMHEPAMHGWRLADRHHMRMTGYPSRVKSMSFSAGGKWLATSGADAVILWPFQSKDGPIGKQPTMYAPLQSKVTCVACHPATDILAAGYADGTILIVRIADGAEILARRNDGAMVTALAWGPSNTLAFGTDNGHAGLVPLG